MVNYAFDTTLQLNWIYNNSGLENNTWINSEESMNLTNKNQDIATNFSSILNSINPLFQSCSSMFGEVSSNLDTMDTEARAAPLQFRASMVAQVRERDLS